MDDNEKLNKEMTEVSAFVGQYVLSYQHIEAAINEMFHLLVGQKHRHLIMSILVKLSYRDKLEIIKGHLTHHIEEYEDALKLEWMEERVLPAFSRLEKVMSERNSLVHGTYIYEFFEHGGPILQGRSKVKKGGVNMSSIAVDSAYRNKMILEIAELSIEIGQIKIQIIHWFDYFQQT